MDDALLFTPVVRERLEMEASYGNDQGIRDGDGEYWAVSHKPSNMSMAGPWSTDDFLLYPLTDERRGWLQNLSWNLNKNLCHDGAWICVWTHLGELVHEGATFARHPRRVVLIWLDQDGDPQVPVEIEEPWLSVASQSVDNWLEQCEEAYQAWHLLMRDVLDPREGQTFQRAKGQSAASLKHGRIQ
jgi:hypothetical protein